MRWPTQGLKDPIVPCRGHQVAILVLRGMECLFQARPLTGVGAGRWLRGLSSTACKPLGLHTWFPASGRRKPASAGAVVSVVSARLEERTSSAA